jgi:glycosyltransferase involved in cell wall biosynthesis
MRILHIITRLILGGAQQNTVLSCAAQVAAGHAVFLAHGPIYGPEGSLLQDAKGSGATLIQVPTMRRAILPGHDYLCYRALRQVVRQVQPDLVHTHSSKAGIVGRAAAWTQARRHPKRLPRVIHTVHGLPFHDRQNPLVRRMYIALERWAAKRCDALVAITPQMVEAFERHHIAARDKFTVIPSGIAVERFALRDARRTTEAIGDGPVVGLVARLDPLKGHADLLAAYPRIAEKIPGNPGVRVRFVGDGFARSAIAAHPLIAQGVVTITGLVPFEAMAEEYRKLDVCVLPSYQEGQSRVLAEALLCGCGIVAYDVGGIPALCIDGVTGKLVPPGNIDALADAIVWMLQHPAERQAMARRGRELVLERFGAERMNVELLALYHRVLG